VKAEKKRCPEKYAARFAGLPFTQINAPNFYPEKLEKKREEKAKSQASEINKELTESPNIQIRIQVQSCRLSQLLSVSDRRFVATPISHFFP